MILITERVQVSDTGFTSSSIMLHNNHCQIHILRLGVGHLQCLDLPVLSKSESELHHNPKRDRKRFGLYTHTLLFDIR